MKSGGAFILVSVAALTTWGQPAAAPIITSTWTIAGADVVLPNPEGDFSEIDDRVQALFEQVLPSEEGWLLTTYLSREAKQNLLNATKIRRADLVGPYALVAEPRSAAYARMDEHTFDLSTQRLQSSLGNPALIGKATGIPLDDVNRQLKVLGFTPIPQKNLLQGFRTLFRKSNALAFAVSGDEQGAARARATAIMRVKGRVLFVSMCQAYESPETIASLGKSLDNWTTQILLANK